MDEQRDRLGRFGAGEERWERDLKPRGFHLAARVMDYPDGEPGDFGLFLVWAEVHVAPGARPVFENAR